MTKYKSQIISKRGGRVGAFDIPQPNPAVPSSCSLPLVLAVSKQRQAAAVQSNPDRANRDPRDWLRGISSQVIVYRYSEAGWCVWRRLCPQSLDARARGFPIILAPSIAYTAAHASLANFGRARRCTACESLLFYIA